MTQNIDQEITAWLSEMADLEAALDALRLQMEEDIAEVYTPEIRAQVKAIESDHQFTQQQTQDRIADLRERIKAGVLHFGNTVKGDGAQAIWIKPRVSWDTRALDGYAASHPEIERFRKVGKPSVSIRRMTRKEAV